MTDPLFILTVCSLCAPFLAASIGWTMGEAARQDDERQARREQHWRNIARLQSGFGWPVTEGFVSGRWPS